MAGALRISCRQLFHIQLNHWNRIQILHPSINGITTRTGGVRFNSNIPYKTIRLILPDGTNKGQISTTDALKLVGPSQELKIVSTDHDIPICKIFDIKPKRPVVKQSPPKRKEPKELEIGTNIANGDLLVKIKKCNSFLEKGLSVMVRFNLKSGENSRSVDELLGVFRDKVDGKFGQLTRDKKVCSVLISPNK